MRSIQVDDFENVEGWIITALSLAPVVDVGEWQAIQGNIPQARTIEVEDVSFALSIPRPTAHATTEDLLYLSIGPNFPWAEDHFLERVSGIAYNPPPSSEWWPHATANNEAFKSEEKFSHTYPERMWPKYSDDSIYPRDGIRYPYGDLNDVVHLLRDRPGTRQAYLPIWFPEDTGAVDGQRVPCTLGYHFLVRDGKLKIVYYIRSCDFYRHFRDDVYMAARLGQWVAQKLGVHADKLVMHISSLHIFESERERIKSDLGVWRYNHSVAVQRD